MWRDVFAYAGCYGNFFKDLPETQARHAAAAIGDKEVVTPFAPENMRTSAVQIILYFAFCCLAKGNETLLVSFAHDTDKTSIEVTGN